LGIALSASLILGGCAGAQKRVELRTEPTNATVAHVDAGQLGSTPLVLAGDQLERLSREDRLVVTLDSPGYASRELVLDLHGDDSYTVSLSKLDDGYFRQRFLKDYHVKVNEMARALLKAQGLIMTRNLDEAERLLVEFQESYPNVASSYALRGNIELLRGEPEKARSYLLRAEALDPNDPEIKRGLGIQVKQAPKAQGKPAASKAKPKGKGRK
jgi:hypothetical protein